MPGETDELLAEVVTECLEHIDQMENLLLALEGNAQEIDPEVINSIFRSAHSIKGVTGFCGLNNIKELAHVFENVLNAYRQGQLTPNAGSVDIMLKANDFLKTMLINAAESESFDIDPMVRNLAGILEPGADATSVLVPEKLTFLSDSTGRFTFTVDEAMLQDRISRGHHLYILRLDLVRDAPVEKRTPIELVNHILSLGEMHETAFELDLVHVDEEAIRATVPLAVLFSSLIDSSMVAGALAVPAQDVDHLESLEPGAAIPLARAVPEQVVLPPTRPTPPPARESKATAAPPITPERPTASTPRASVASVPSSPVAAAPSPQAPPKKATAVPVQPPKPPAPPEPPRVQEPPRESAPEYGPPDGEPGPVVEAVKTPSTVVQNFLRVNVSLLDNLMNLAGELVLGRNQLLQTAGTINSSSLTPVAQRIDLITSELQAQIMQTRMQELAGVFNKFPRLVRDLSRSLGKKVDLKIEGQEVELDKTIIEALGDPLVHIVRNSMDHGIERPETRRAAGKPEMGTLEVRAYHEAGQVNIEIRDDGAGIDISRLKDKALRMGLISPMEAQTMSAQQALELIFKPGLSTAETVSDVSGRGVGMDVVRSNLERLGGILDLQSEKGKGTNTRIKLPLTMAIIPCLIVRLGKGERYAVPQINLTELVRVRSAEVGERIERIGGAEVLRLRGNLLPLVRLGEVLRTEGFFRDPITNELKKDRRQNIADRRAGESDEAADQYRIRRSGQDRRQSTSPLNILVLSAGDLEYGLIVDELEDTEEIVVKPLGRHLKEIPSYAGATIMGDGRVAPILDVPGLAQQAELGRKKDVAQKTAQSRAKEEMAARKDMEKVLVFNHGPQELFAVPIPLVARIERIDAGRIETAMGHLSVQYRGSSLRLIMLDRHLPLTPFPTVQKVFVIVFEVAGHEIGICASTLVDERLVPFDLDVHTHQRLGVMGSMIIDHKTVLVLDIFELVGLEEPRWLQDVTKPEKPATAPKVLLVEDSEFFLKKVAGYLKDSGFEVVLAMNGREGLEKLEKNKIDIVLTDIEMPVMNGIEMVRQIRANPKYAGMRILALSSLAGDDDIQRGIAAGVDKYLIKLDRGALIDALMEPYV
jgi:two-component system chemotaxis sensor kinase CheA